MPSNIPGARGQSPRLLKKLRAFALQLAFPASHVDRAPCHPKGQGMPQAADSVALPFTKTDRRAAGSKPSFSLTARLWLARPLAHAGQGRFAPRADPSPRAQAGAARRPLRISERRGRGLRNLIFAVVSRRRLDCSLFPMIFSAICFDSFLALPSAFVFDLRLRCCLFWIVDSDSRIRAVAR